MAVSLADLLPDASWDPSSDVLLDRFLQYAGGKGLVLYPAQEEAILELLDGKNVVLNTPTGSGKSLVASAMLFALAGARAAGRLHMPDQGARQREMDGAVPRVRPGPGGPLDRRRERQPRRAHSLLHRRDPRQHRAARRPGRRHRRRGDGRVPLLRRPRPRRRMAGAAADDAADALPADVGDARRYAVLRGGHHSPQRARDGHGEVRRSPRSPRVRLLRDPAGAYDREARGRGQDARLRRPLHAGGRGEQRAGLHQPQDLHQGAEGRDRRAYRRLRLQQPVRRRHPQVAAARRRAAPRGTAAQVPRPGRAARAGRTAEGDLRDGHARRGHQRANPDGPVHPPVQVRRPEDGPPERPRVPSDRRARRAQGIRRPRLRRRAGAGARHREHPARRKGGALIDEQEGRQAEAPRAQLRQLGPEHVQAADRSAARAARLAVPGVPRHAAERAEPARRRLPCDAAAAPRLPRAGGREAGPPAPRVAAVPGARCAPCRRVRAADPPGRRQGARQRRPAGRLLDGPDVVPVSDRDAAAARLRVAGLRARRAHAGGINPREPRADPAENSSTASRTARSRR